MRRKNRKVVLLIVMTAGGEKVAVYRDGEDVPDEILALEEQTETADSKFLNTERVAWSLICYVCWSRTDENKFDLK